MSELLSGLANITKSVSESFNSYEIRKLGDKVQGMVMNYSEAEVKVREATNEDPWGPTGPQMTEITNLTGQYESFTDIMSMLWKRMLHENKSAWRRVYKSLILLNHLVKNGSDRVVGNVRDHLFELRSLESYKYVDEKGKDQGANVRHRANLLIELIQDDDLLRTERNKARIERKEKYQGFSRDDMSFNSRASSFAGRNKNSYMDWSDRPSDFKTSRHSEYSDEFRNREVNSFQFPDEGTRNGRESPELGIREHTPNPADDSSDEFGEFAQARNIDEPKGPSFSSNTNSFAHNNIPKISPPQPKSSLVTNTVAVSFKSIKESSGEVPNRDANAVIDLLGLESDIADFQSQDDNVNNLAHTDIFGLIDSQSSTVKLDFHGRPSGMPQQLDSHHHQFSPELTDIAPVQSNSSTVDLNFCNNVDFGSLLSVPSVQLFDNLPSQLPTISKSASPVVQSTVTDQSKSVIKMPSIWSDASSKVNISLDNLGLRSSPAKQAPSMNQMAKDS